MLQTTVNLIGLILLGILYYANLFSVPNIGQQSGLITPYNLGVYVVASLFIVWNLYRIISSKRLVVSLFVVVFSFPFTLLLIIGGLQTSDWYEYKYQAGAIFVGFLFVFALMQYRWENHHWFSLFYAFVILGLIQGLIALDQRFDPFGVLYTLSGYFPLKMHNAYLGSLQQKNMFASFMAFAVVLSVFLLLQPSFKRLNVWGRFPLYALAFLGVFLVTNSGSRVGFLALTIGVALLLWGARMRLYNHKSSLGLWVIASLLGLSLNLFVPVVGVNVADKFSSVLTGLDIRWFMYESGLKLFLENFWFGVGIGNYPSALQEFIFAHQLWLDSRIVNFDISRITHPHNELLYWLIQVGVIGMLPILLGLIALLVNWFKQGRERFFVLLALSLPLILQALVSYPFELSATHYFLVLLLLVYGTQFKTQVIKFQLSRMIQVGVVVVLLVMVLAIARYAYQSASASFETYYFKNRLFLYKKYPEQEVKGYFKYASGNELYRELVLNNMQNLFHQAVRDNNFYDLKQYLLWYRQQEMLPKVYKAYAVQAEQLLERSNKRRVSE